MAARARHTTTSKITTTAVWARTRLRRISSRCCCSISSESCGDGRFTRQEFRELQGKKTVGNCRAGRPGNFSFLPSDEPVLGFFKMKLPTVPIDIQDPVNAKILAISEDKIQGFQPDPLGEVARLSEVELPLVTERIQAMLRDGTIRRVRQTLL